MSFGGSEKFLQIMAKHLNKDKYEVYFMYSSQELHGREEYLKSSGVNLIDFSYDSVSGEWPFYIKGMRPSIFDILEKNNIDLVITAGAGYPEYPIANISKLPIVFVNIFGGINPQENIRKHMCISNLLAEILKEELPGDKIEVIPIPSEEPDADAEKRGRALRARLGIGEADIVFGRIGRPEDNIFDPIGIRAFQLVVTEHPRTHYLIMAPPPVLKKIVREERIINVHFLPPSAKEEDIWAFYAAIDVLAHFRKDGETMGLNIAEAMLSGKPIISHKSRYWNAHLEYLDKPFAFVAEVDDVPAYAAAMKFFTEDKSKRKMRDMGKLAKAKAISLFHIDRNIGRIESVIRRALP